MKVPGRMILIFAVAFVGVVVSLFVVLREGVEHREADEMFARTTFSRPFSVRSRREDRDGYTYVIEMADGRPLALEDVTPPPKFEYNTGPGPRMTRNGMTTIALFGGGLPDGGPGGCSIVIDQATQNPGPTARVWSSCWHNDG